MWFFLNELIVPFHLTKNFTFWKRNFRRKSYGKKIFIVFLDVSGVVEDYDDQIMIRKITVYIWFVMAMFLCSKGSLWRATDDLLQRTMPYLLIPKTKLITFCLLTKAAADIQTVVSGTLINIFFKMIFFTKNSFFEMTSRHIHGCVWYVKEVKENC